MNEIKPRETVNAMKIISDNFESLIKQIEELRNQLRDQTNINTDLNTQNNELRKQLELTEKRALDWEQMHLDELQHRQRLEMNLADAHKAIRDQVERNQSNPQVHFAERMEALTREDIERRREEAASDYVLREAHNKAVRENVEKQSKIMQENLVLHRVNTDFNKAHHEMVIRSVDATEKQTLLMESISACLNELVSRGRL